MSWPNSQDYNEAIQNAQSSFADPALKKGEVVVNALGLPVPRSGNFADVYQFQGGDGKMWAVKCFTRKVSGLQERYARIDEHLTQSNLPFTVGFKYLEQGIRIRGEWFPLLKMEWVEGFTLNEFVRDNVGKPKYLHALMQMWAKLTGRLRDANIAHADLQHGNVLLVPGTSQTKLGLKLIDYDGMWLPALADKHSGEVGHPNFQHPHRLKDRLFNAEVDRFPHLVIACALRATLLGGKALWDRFDNGDNLLFRESDLRAPAKAEIFRELWEFKDNVLCALLGHLALATQEPLRKTPWLDDLLLGKNPPALSDTDENKVIEMLGVKAYFTAEKFVPTSAAGREEFSVFAFIDDDDPVKSTASGKYAAKKTSSNPDLKVRAKRQPEDDNEEPAKSKLPWYIGGGVAAVALLGLVIALASGGKKNEPVQPAADKSVASPPGKSTDVVVLPKTKGPVEPLVKFIPLFNGKTMSSWTADSGRNYNWRVENNAIVGSSLAGQFGKSLLSTDAAGFDDFHLLVETMRSVGPSSAIVFRKDCEVVIGGSSPDAESKTGDLRINQTRVVNATPVAIEPGAWFTQEVIAIGDRIAVKVNGQIVANYRREDHTPTSGPISLLCRADSVVRFRKVEYRALKASDEVVNSLPPPVEPPKFVKKNDPEPMPKSVTPEIKAGPLTLTQQVNADFAGFERMGFSRDGKWLYVVGKGFLAIVNAATGVEQKRLTVDGEVRDVAFGAQDELYLTAADDQFQVWNWNKGLLLGDFDFKEGKVQPIQRVLETTDPNRLLVSASSPALSWWDIGRWKVADRFLPYGAEKIRLEAAFPDGNSVLLRVGEKADRLCVWDIAKNREAFALSDVSLTERYRSEISPNGKWIVGYALDLDGEIRIWDARDGKVLHRLNDIRTSTMSGGFTAGGNYYTFREGDGLLRVLDLEQGKVTQDLRPAIPPKHVASSAAANVVATFDSDARVRLWKANLDGTPANVSAVRPPERPEPPKPLAVPPRAYRLTTNSLAGKAFIDPATVGPNPAAPKLVVPTWTPPKDGFARLSSKGLLSYPSLPISRYVFEIELTPSKLSELRISFGDTVHDTHLNLLWNATNSRLDCVLTRTDFVPAMIDLNYAAGEKHLFKVVVGDGRQALFHDNQRVSTISDIWPSDCAVRINCKNPDIVIHRCSLRPMTDQDAADCQWTTPPIELRGTPQASAARLARLAEGYPSIPKPGESLVVKSTNTPMVWIQPGEFEMGSRIETDLSRHRVSLKRGYWMAQTEVTQKEFARIMATNPSRVTGSAYLPVDSVTWDQAVLYCKKLTDLERANGRLSANLEYRLPTEAEWEYACRAGADTNYSVPENTIRDRTPANARPFEVATSPPNKWGLYDMHGNVMEWCLDAFGGYPYNKTDITVDPFKPAQLAPDKEFYVVRGGAWWAGRYMSSSHWRGRSHSSPNLFCGFRIVLGPVIKR